MVRWRMRTKNFMSRFRSLVQRSRPHGGRVDRLRRRLDPYQDGDDPPFA